MLKKNKLMFFPILMLTSFSLLAKNDECGNYKTKYIMEGKPVIKTEELCLHKKKTFEGAYSKNCVIVNGEKCPFKAVKKGMDYQTFIKEIGSPSFNLCYYVGGIPQMYEIEIKGQWKPFERCTWSESKEFIELSDLVEYYRSL